MTMKLLGAVLVIVGCGGVGFFMCHNHRKEERAMEQLLRSLEWMILELNYRMPPLAVLCRGAAEIGKGAVGQFFEELANELEHQLTPDVSTCVTAAILTVPGLSATTEAHLRELGTSMGNFDLSGQICGLEAAKARCDRELQILSSEGKTKLRSYQTIGICAGVALVILFI